MTKFSTEANIKAFWEARGDKYKEVPFESLSNFEENPQTLSERIAAEQELVFSKLILNKHQTILDLGAGVGQWAFRFAPLVERVVAVEFALSQIEIARQETVKRAITNIDFIHASAESFLTNELFDVVFISGLIVYLNEKQLDQLVLNIKRMLKPHGVLFLREPSSILAEKFEIINQYSEALKTNYSAIYRTACEINSLFESKGFLALENGQVFSEGSLLNKFPETRLKYYIYNLAN